VAASEFGVDGRDGGAASVSASGAAFGGCGGAGVAGARYRRWPGWVGGVTARVRGWGSEAPDAAVGSRCVINPSHAGQPLDAVWMSGQLVPVTTWVHPDRLIPAQPYRPAGRYGHWTRNPYALGGLVVAVAVVATLVACLVIALLALVAWLTAHAVAVGVGMAAVVITGLAFLRALTGAPTAGLPPHGGCCR
jgi:hypothetical protein